jgi:hypothetical protein
MRLGPWPEAGSAVAALEPDILSDCFLNFDEADIKLDIYGSESVESKAAIQVHRVKS